MADPTPETPAPAPVDAQADEPLREPGLKALQMERERGDALKAQLEELKQQRPDGGVVAAVAAARRDAEKERAKLAAQLKAYEDRDKTEAERQADRLAALEKSNRDLAAEKARYEAAFEHGLSKDDLALLGPGDDIAERAALLAQRLGVIKPPPARLPESPNAGREARRPATSVSAGREMFAAKRKTS